MNQTDRSPLPVTTELAGLAPSLAGANPNTFTEAEMIGALNDMIETCRDGQQGFKEAAENATSPNLKTIFSEYSQQRASYVGDLQTLVQTLGGDAKEEGSLSAALHRGWINIRSAVTGRDDEGILSECERGEDLAKNAYEAAVKMPFPTYILDTLRSQFMGVQEAHQHIKTLRDGAGRERPAEMPAATAGGGH